MKKISIVIPAYNEEESIPFLYERLTKLIESIKNYEFERLIECNWRNKSNKDFVGSISIISVDSTGIISKITKKFNDEKVPMIGLNVKKIADGNLAINIQVNIKDKSQLDNLINKLRQSNLAIDVYRTV